MTRMPAILLGLVACASPGSDPAAGGPPSAPRIPPAAVAPEPATSPIAAPGPGGSRRAAEPRVGGCREACATPRQAVAGFLEATARPGAEEAVPRFLDATRLVLDERDLGARWSGWSQDLKFATRTDDIREVVRDLVSWTDGLSPGPVRDALTAGPKAVRIWTTEAEFEFAIPGAPTWNLVLAPRGVEWLVVRIRRDGTTAPVSGI